MMNSLGIGENRASCGPARMHLLLNGKVARTFLRRFQVEAEIWICV